MGRAYGREAKGKYMESEQTIEMLERFKEKWPRKVLTDNQNKSWLTACEKIDDAVGEALANEILADGEAFPSINQFRGRAQSFSLEPEETPAPAKKDMALVTSIRERYPWLRKAASA